MLEAWTRAVLRFRLLVLACWAAILVAGVLLAAMLPGLVSNSFEIPGSESERARLLLADHFGERPDGTFTVVLPVDDPGDRVVRASVRERIVRAARAVPGASVGELREGSELLFADVSTTHELKRAKRYTEALRSALGNEPGTPAYVTGQPAIQHDLDPIFRGDRRRAEAIAVSTTLVVLLVLFGPSLAVLIPFVVAACTIAGTLAIVYGVAHLVPPVAYVTNLVELIGLGLAIDYSLLMVSRFREEVADPGEAADEAVVRTMATAGRAVVVSGLAVAIGLALLFFVPVPFIRSIGFAGFLIPVTAVAAAVTLQPVLLSLLGRRAPGRTAPGETGFWTRVAGTVMRRPRTFLVGGVALLVAAAVPAVFIDVTPGALAGLPRSIESMRGYDLLRDGVGPGAITPMHIVMDTGDEGRARSAEVRRAVDRLVDDLAADGEAYIIAFGGRQPSYVDETGRYRQLIVVGRHEYGEAETRAFVERVRERHLPGAGFPPGVRAYTGGAPPQGYDFLARAYSVFPWLVLGALLLTYIALVRAFRSLLLPLKAVLLNALTVAAVYGVLVLVFQWGFSREVEGWIPIFLFAVLFGLSMDYEVFLVSRMREAWDRERDNAAAVAEGLERTGRIVTAAAIVMVVVFAGFVAGRIDALRQFGFAVALAVLIDATLVRAILVPSLMTVLGRWNWWLPEPVARLVRVDPSPL